MPFWDGADEAERIERWRRDVGWQEEWGRVDPVGRLNGSSGRAVRDQVLRPLGLGPDDVWLTDALPFFLVHRGPRTQGAAMAERYDTFARSRGLRCTGCPTGRRGRGWSSGPSSRRAHDWAQAHQAWVAGLEQTR